MNLNKKSKKGKYQTSVGNNNIALLMDTLRDSYRIREKMFPAIISFVDENHRNEYSSLLSLAESFEKETGTPDIYRYDLDGNFIKRHIYRTV